MDKTTQQKLFANPWQLPSVRCRRRILDFEFLKADLADAKSLIAKKLTQEEKDWVLAERGALAWKCVHQEETNAPYLYNFADKSFEFRRAYPDSELKHVADQLKKAAVTGAGSSMPSRPRNLLPGDEKFLKAQF